MSVATTMRQLPPLPPQTARDLGRRESRCLVIAQHRKDRTDARLRAAPCAATNGRRLRPHDAA